LCTAAAGISEVKLLGSNSAQRGDLDDERQWNSKSAYVLQFDAIRFDAIRFDAIRFDAIRFDAIRRQLAQIDWAKRKECSLI
jgi:hypothetical protein